MKISEIRGWQWVIAWDNPKPADSSTMRADLKKLGRITKVQTKTTVILAPNSTVTWRQIRKAIESNLHPKKGNAVYVNLRSKSAYEWGKKTKYKWSRVV